MKLLPKTVATLITQSADAARVRDGMTAAVQPTLDFLNNYFQAAGDGSLRILRNVAVLGNVFSTNLTVTGLTSLGALSTAAGVPQVLDCGTYWNTSAAANTNYQTVKTVYNNSGGGVGTTPFIWKFPRAGSVVGFSLNNAGPVTGNNSIGYYKNGSSLATVSAGAGGNNAAFWGTHPKGTYAFAAGDTLTTYVSNASAGNLQVSLLLTVEMGA